MNGSDSPEMRALDAALSAALVPPALPADFDRRLAAALQAAPRDEWSRAARATLEQERRERLAEFESDYVRLRRRTFGTLIGAAFAAGAALTLAMPWLQRAWGTNLPYLLAGGAAVICLTLVAASLVRAGVRIPWLVE
jgi:hypothetical protein